MANQFETEMAALGWRLMGSDWHERFGYQHTTTHQMIFWSSGAGGREVWYTGALKPRIRYYDSPVEIAHRLMLGFDPNEDDV